MWRRFTGTSVHKVDAKGRVSVPASFRRVLDQSEDDGFVLIPRFQGLDCIECFKPAFAEQISERIDRMKPFSAERRALERLFVAAMEPAGIDDNGRMILSPKLKAAVGITDSAVFTGMNSSFQIWAPANFEAYNAANAADQQAAFDALDWGDAL